MEVYGSPPVLFAYNILVTGATGFLGRALIDGLKRSHRSIVGGSRTGDGKSLARTPSLAADANWLPHLIGITAVIHCAAHVHIFRRSDPTNTFYRVNAEGTFRLARQAAAMGVKRFVFISTIGVNGTSAIHPLTERDAPKPEDPYSNSKRVAEDGLMQIAHDTGMEIVIIRPTLIYGPCAGGNFAFLARAIRAGIPLPFGAFDNHRTLIGMRNLVELIDIALEHPGAANQVFLAGDAESVTIAELCRMISTIVGRSNRLFYLPPAAVQLAATLAGNGERIQRLRMPLIVDSSKATTVMNWRQTMTLRQGLTEALTGAVLA